MVASISSKKPRSLSCATHELKPRIPIFEIDTNTSGFTCKNERGGQRGGLKNIIGSLSVESSQLTCTMRSRKAVKSGRFNSNFSSLWSVSSCVNRRGWGSRSNCDGVCPKLLIIPGHLLWIRSEETVWSGSYYLQQLLAQQDWKFCPSPRLPHMNSNRIHWVLRRLLDLSACSYEEKLKLRIVLWGRTIGNLPKNQVNPVVNILGDIFRLKCPSMDCNEIFRSTSPRWQYDIIDSFLCHLQNTQIEPTKQPI